MSSQDARQRQRRKLPQQPRERATPNKLGSATQLQSSSPQLKATPLRDTRSNVMAAGQRLEFSPPGTKPREFLGYTPPEPDTKEEWEDSSVTVAVRIRPFSER